MNSLCGDYDFASLNSSGTSNHNQGMWLPCILGCLVDAARSQASLARCTRNPAGRICSIPRVPRSAGGNTVVPTRNAKLQRVHACRAVGDWHAIPSPSCAFGCRVATSADQKRRFDSDCVTGVDAICAGGCASSFAFFSVGRTCSLHSRDLFATRTP